MVLLAATSFVPGAAVSNATDTTFPTTYLCRGTLRTDLSLTADTSPETTFMPFGSTSVVAGVFDEFFGGAGVYNGDGIPATTAVLRFPNSVIYDRLGNMYISELERIRRVDKNTGIITTIAGKPDGLNEPRDGILATSASLYPTNIVFDAFGDLHFYSNALPLRIRTITTTTVIITSVAGNGEDEYNGEDILGTRASIFGCSGIVFDMEGNLFYISIPHSKTHEKYRPCEDSGWEW